MAGAKLVGKGARARRSAAVVQAHVVQRPGAAPRTLLDETLDACGFWPLVRKHRGPVVIKPDLDFYEAVVHGGTDPVLVEHLIDLLHDHGFDDVAVGDARNEPDDWLHNREPMMVPELAGYRFVTPAGRPYEVIDVRPGNEIAARWRGAALRINFAKNRTHEDCHYALCLYNLLGLAPEAGGREERCLAVLRQAPPHFNLIDAHVSAHGGAGQRAPRPLATHALIASENALLADWAGAVRMGLDPYASPLNAAALRALGLPPRHAIEGDLAPYPLWRNVHPLLAQSARRRNRSETLRRTSAAWLQTVDRERFGFRDFSSDTVNSFVAPLLQRVDEQPRSFWLAVALNHLLARLEGFVLAQRTLFAKDRLRRIEAPLLLDPTSFGDADYDAIAPSLGACERLLRDAPPRAGGLRWRKLDGAIVFANEHVFPIPFARFVRKVDIAAAIRYMNDYIGGATVVVRRDKRGRALRQLERNLYLPQPNWLVLFGGETIDVEKIQQIRYEPGRHVIHWRTVSSPNRSALADDGTVSFERTEDGHTRVRVLARQQFKLPLAFQAFDVDLVPALRDPIVDAAYTRFFEGTMANLQAAFDGRDHRIGHVPKAEAPELTLPRFLATAAAALAELLRERATPSQAADAVAWLVGTGAAREATVAARPEAELDAAGFRHFAPAAAETPDRDDRWVAGLAALTRDAPEFFQGLAEAVRHDLDRLADPAAPA